MFSSKNGPALTSSSIFQATATPGPREKEIVNYSGRSRLSFRKGQQSRKGKRLTSRRKKGKESETVDSLLKLLRKNIQFNKEKQTVTVTLAETSSWTSLSKTARLLKREILSYTTQTAV